MTFKTVDLRQGSTEWLDWRMTRWCASEASIIMLCPPKWSKYSSWDDLRLVKAGFAEYDEWTTKAMMQGSEREKEALEYANKHFASYKPACIQNLDEPKLCASLDGLYTYSSPSTGDDVRWLEIKCPVTMPSDKIRWYDGVRDWDDLPLHHQWQVAHQFAALGVDEATLDYLIFPENEGPIHFRRTFDTVYMSVMKFEADELIEQWRQWEDGELPGRADDKWKEASNRYFFAKLALDDAKADVAAARGALIDLAEDYDRLPYGNGVRVDHSKNGWVVRISRD